MVYDALEDFGGNGAISMHVIVSTEASYYSF
jgi:hypothetical protein